MPRTRAKPSTREIRLRAIARRKHAARRRTVTTLGDLVSAAFQVTGSSTGAARLLDESSPLGHLLDRRIVVG